MQLLILFFKSCIYNLNSSALNKLDEIPALIFNYGLLKEGGVFILEHGKQKDFTNVPHFVEHRAYGSVNFSIFK